MKKIIILSLVLLSLAVIAYFSITGKNSTLHKKDNSFAIATPDEITRIQIHSSEAETLLEMTDEGWKVNDQTAYQQRVQDILMISGLIDATSPVSDSQYDSIKSLLKEGIQIRFFEDAKCVKSYRICKWNNKIYGQREQSKQSFRLAVKGYPEIDLTRVFNAMPSNWLSDIILDHTPDEIDQISLIYPSKPDRNFTLRVIAKDRFQLLNKESEDYTKQLNNTAAEEYLYFFSSIRYSQVPSSWNEKLKKIEIETPLFNLEIRSNNGEIIGIKGFQNSDPVSGNADPYQFVAMTADKGFILLKYSDFDPILVSLDYFLKK